jgi:hypothetical protein
MLPASRYHCRIAPAAIRFIVEEEGYRDVNNGGEPMGAAAGNIGDPVMTALLILNTRNVERETVEAPPKLQRARAKSNKPPIPAFDRVNTAPYVTAILTRGQRRKSEPQGGTHASPQFHIRMGHPRRYTSDRWKAAGGRSIFIADTLVNASDEQREAFKSQRSHYSVR